MIALPQVSTKSINTTFPDHGGWGWGWGAQGSRLIKLSSQNLVIGSNGQEGGCMVSWFGRQSPSSVPCWSTQLLI